MKGTLYANPTFLQKKIYKANIISIHPFVAFDEHRIYFKNHLIKWPHKQIVNCTYSKQFNVLLILTDDCKIFVYTENLQKITALNNWEPKYIVGFKLIEQLGILLLLGTEQIQLMKVSILSNIKKTKFLSSMKFNIKIHQHLEVKQNDRLKWNKGFNYSIKQDLFYVWSLQDIHFFSLKTLAVKTKITSLSKKQNSLTTAYFSPQFKYTVIGQINGDVKVWRLPISQLYYHKQILIHTFSFHLKQVQQIIPGYDQKTIVTYALDMCIYFLSLQTFQQLRSFNFIGQYSKIFLYNHVLAYAIKDNQIGQLNYGVNMQFITDLTGSPIGHDFYDKDQNTLTLQFTINSNMGIELNRRQIQKSNQLNKAQIKYIYAPLKSKNIIQIIVSPYDQNTYYLLMDNGDIFKASMHDLTSRIQYHYVIYKSRDSQKHQFSQNPVIIHFGSILPPKIDTQIMQMTVDKTYPQSSSQKLQLKKRLKLMAIACHRGSIVFVPTQDMDNIYCRISYHRQKILQFRQIITDKQSSIISYCEQKYLKIINFNNKKANCVTNIYCGQLYVKLFSFQQYLLLVLPKGIFQICTFQPEPIIHINYQAINHEDDIVSVDYRADYKMILTAAKDNKIRIWTTFKLLLYQINIDSCLQYAVWGKQVSIILSQNNKIYSLRKIPFSVRKKQIDQRYQNYIQNYHGTMQIKDFVQNQMAKIHQQNIKINDKNMSQSNVFPQFHHQSFNSPIKTQNRSSINGILMTPQRKRLKTQQKQYKSQKRYKNNEFPLIKKKQSIKTQSNQQQKDKKQSQIFAVKKHLQEIAEVKKIANQSILPKLKPKNQDIFVEFMRQKLLNKKLLTRRDITVNRIIFKNLLKQHVQTQHSFINGLKLD